MPRIPLVLVIAVLSRCDESGAEPNGAELASVEPLGPVASLVEGGESRRPAPVPTDERPNVVVHVASGSNVSASDAAAMASVMRSGFRRCAPPDGKRSIFAELSVEAQPSGKIDSASVSGGDELPEDFKQCLERRARVAYFPATDAGARVKLRVRFESRR